MDVSSTMEISGWIQVAVQGGAMGLLVLIILQGPVWITRFITSLITTVVDQQRELGERFIKALDDARMANQKESKLDRTAFEKRNDILRETQEAVRLAIVSQEAEFRAVLLEVKGLTHQVRRISRAAFNQAKAITKMIGEVTKRPDEPEKN